MKQMDHKYSSHLFILIMQNKCHLRQLQNKIVVSLSCYVEKYYNLHTMSRLTLFLFNCNVSVSATFVRYRETGTAIVPNMSSYYTHINIKI